MAMNQRCCLFRELENKLYVAMADPLNVIAIDDIKRVTKLDIQPMIAPEKAIIDKINNLDAAPVTSMSQIIDEADKAARELKEEEEVEITKEISEEVNLDQLIASGEEAPVIKLANIILVQAIKDRASDIHIEPFEKTMRLRYRLTAPLLICRHRLKVCKSH
jgi:type IV pilus assembly protein PilB